jgi:hypothetical protein
MATKQFGVAYDAATTLTGTETVSIVQGGAMVDATAAQFAALAGAAAVPTGTGYYHVTAGVMDAASTTASGVATDVVNAGTGLGSTEVAFRHIPQNSQSAAYTLVAADNGKHIYHPSADTTARVWTIPANASVAYPIGTALTFINDTSAGVITIAITSDTLILAGAGTTGSRTLAANGMATAIKMTSTRWMISGTGLT